MTGERVIERAGEGPTDWTLLVTASGEVVARRQVPFDGDLLDTLGSVNRRTENDLVTLDLI